MINKLILLAIDGVLEEKEFQDFFKGVGKKLGEEIPGDMAEPKINKIVDLVQEGMMSTVEK